MSMADIIMQASAQGQAAVSQGIRDIGKGVAGGIMRHQESEANKEMNKTKMRYMNAQAASMETTAQANKNKMDSQVKFESNLKYIADNDLSDAEGEKYLNTHGSAAEATNWRSDKEAIDMSQLSQEIGNLTKVADTSKVLKSNFASVTNEQEFEQAKAYTVEQLGEDVFEGAEGSWQEQQRMFMGSAESAADISSQRMEALRLKNRTKTEKLVEAVHAAEKGKDPLMKEATQKDLRAHMQQEAALTDMKEMEVQKEQRAEHAQFSASAKSTLDTFLGMEVDSALLDGYSEVTNHLIEQQKQAWTPERTQVWLEGFIDVEQDEGFLSTGLFSSPSKITINPLAPGPVSMRGGEVRSMAKQKAEAEAGTASAERARFDDGYKGKDKEAAWKRYLKQKG